MPVLIWDRDREQVNLQQYCNYVEEKYGSIIAVVTLGHIAEAETQTSISYTPTIVAITYTKEN